MLRRISGYPAIILATVVAGIVGYLITWLVPRLAGAEVYAVFAVFWATLYLVVSALSGIQQEVTRATTINTNPDPGRRATARNFGLIVAGIVVLATLSTAVIWVGPVFGEDGWALLLPLALGVGSYVMVATLVGTLNGIRRWTLVAGMVGVDALLRMLLIGVALVFTTDVVVLAWLIVIPFPLAIILVWPAARSAVVGRTAFDVGYRNLAWNVARTVAASASMGVLVAGFPVLLHLADRGTSPESFATMVLAITLTRAPIITTITAAQSILVVRFRDHRDSFGSTMIAIQSLVFGAAVVLGALAWWLGPAVFSWLFAGQFAIEAWILSALVVSSAMMGSLIITAAALLARSNHAGYTAGFLVAAVSTIIVLLVPLPFEERTVLALLLPPACGILAQCAAFVVYNRRSAPHEVVQLPNYHQDTYRTGETTDHAE